MPNPAHWSWWRRHDTLLIGAVLVVLLACLAGYNVWVARVTHRNEVTATKVERLTKSQCGETQFLYDFLNALADDTGPGFGSPAGRVIPGARAKLIGRLHDAERASVPRLKAQGCTVRTP
jgi:hypothetical protein